MISKAGKANRWLRYQLIKLRRTKKLPLFVAVIAFSAVLAAHVWVAYSFASSEPNDGDGKLYTQLAVNLLEQGVFSTDPQPPFNPTLIRLPGYPVFLAAVYYFSGHGNNAAAAVVQGVIDTLTCVLVAAIAWAWVQNKRRRRIAAWMAFAMAGLCPFIAIYSATVLTETLTTFLMAAMTLAATWAIRSQTRKGPVLWWSVTGSITGIAVLIRPDSGLFALGIALTLVCAGLFLKSEPEAGFWQRFGKTFLQGSVFSLAFALPLVPWTLRNERLFGVFQPLAPAHAEMPGEFVPHGYFLWVRTWIDDQRYVGPVLWNLEDRPIKVEQLPAYAFDSDDEKQRVAGLLEQYNNSSPEKPIASQDSSDNDSDKEADRQDQDDTEDATDADKDDAENTEVASDDAQQDLKITPDVDEGFARVAQERIARAPVRFYVWIPAKRAAGMWFDTHSMYYPFAGELFPLKDMDNETNQEIWLPLFAALVWIYTLLAFAGAVLLWRTGDRESRLWVLFVLFMTLPRIIFFATLENPEPRYVVELFAYTAILGGIALARVRFVRRDSSVGLEVSYGKD